MEENTESVVELIETPKAEAEDTVASLPPVGVTETESAIKSETHADQQDSEPVVSAALPTSFDAAPSSPDPIAPVESAPSPELAPKPEPPLATTELSEGDKTVDKINPSLEAEGLDNVLKYSSCLPRDT